MHLGKEKVKEVNLPDAVPEREVYRVPKREGIPVVMPQREVNDVPAIPAPQIAPLRQS